MRESRRLAAILAADVAGYSRLMSADESDTLARLKQLRSEFTDPAISKFHGALVGSAGDSILVEFSSALNAIECALEIQTFIANANEHIPDDKRMLLRIGINLGEVMPDGGTIYGAGVNIAARIEKLAQPGDVCVSGSVYEQIRGKADIIAHDLGSHRVHNIPEPVHAYRIELAVGPRIVSPASPSVDKPSVAVLPFTNLSGDVEQAYFSDGITEDVITELSRSRSLSVVARHTSFQFRDKAADVRTIARDLGVRYIVEGTVRKAGSRVRITAQLIDAVAGDHVWSERFDRTIDELFEIQDQVVRTIVGTLVGRLEEAEIAASSTRRPNSLAAYDCLLRGIQRFRSFGAGDNRAARELFEHAVKVDPSYGLAHAYFALSLLAEHRYGVAPDVIKARALEIATKAVQLDPRESRCHAFLGQIHRLRDEFDQALSYLERAIELNPNDATASIHLAHVLAASGRAEEGLQVARRATERDPYIPFAWTTVAMCLYVLRRYDEALSASQKTGASKTAWQLAREAACLAQLDRMVEARTKAKEVLERKPDFSIRSELPRYKYQADADHMREGLTKAGLPE